MASYDGPGIDLKVEAKNSALAWNLVLKFRDGSGTRWLGYYASGPDLNSAVGADFPILVEDELRENKTPMPLDQRKDVRAAMSAVLAGAQAAALNMSKGS